MTGIDQLSVAELALLPCDTLDKLPHMLRGIVHDEIPDNTPLVLRLVPYLVFASWFRHKTLARVVHTIYVQHEFKPGSSCDTVIQRICIDGSILVAMPKILVGQDKYHSTILNPEVMKPEYRLENRRRKELRFLLAQILHRMDRLDTNRLNTKQPKQAARTSVIHAQEDTDAEEKHGLGIDEIIVLLDTCPGMLAICSSCEIAPKLDQVLRPMRHFDIKENAQIVLSTYHDHPVEAELQSLGGWPVSIREVNHSTNEVTVIGRMPPFERTLPYTTVLEKMMRIVNADEIMGIRQPEWIRFDTNMMRPHRVTTEFAYQLVHKEYTIEIRMGEELHSGLVLDGWALEQYHIMKATIRKTTYFTSFANALVDKFRWVTFYVDDFAAHIDRESFFSVLGDYDDFEYKTGPMIMNVYTKMREHFLQMYTHVCSHDASALLSLLHCEVVFLSRTSSIVPMINVRISNMVTNTVMECYIDDNISLFVSWNEMFHAHRERFYNDDMELLHTADVNRVAWNLFSLITLMTHRDTIHMDDTLLNMCLSDVMSPPFLASYCDGQW